jgi:hypothetical protein
VNEFFERGTRTGTKPASADRRSRHTHPQHEQRQRRSAEQG